MLEASEQGLLGPAPEDSTRPSASIGDALDEYCQTHVSTLSRGHEREAQLKRIFDRSRSRDVRSIRQSELVKVLGHWSGPTMNRYRAAVLHFLKFCRQNEWTDLRPELPRARERSRDKVLTIEELRRLYTAAEDMGAWKGFCRLLILTGQRRGEVVSMAPGDVASGWWTLSSTKNGTPHQVWLPEAARAEVGSVPWRGRSGFSNFKKQWDRKAKVTGWGLHDLRRSMTTILAEEGVDHAVIDRMLNHNTVVRGVARTYNRSKLLPARKEAAEKWAGMFFGGYWGHLLE